MSAQRRRKKEAKRARHTPPPESPKSPKSPKAPKAKTDVKSEAKARNPGKPKPPKAIPAQASQTQLPATIRLAPGATANIQYVDFDGVGLEFEGASGTIAHTGFSERTPAIKNTDSDVVVEDATFDVSDNRGPSPRSRLFRRPR
jgi:hypothetical protein